MRERATVSTLYLEHDTRLSNYTLQLDKIADGLCKLGLTQNQAKTYIFLGKYGPQTAPTIFKTLKLPRTETYHLLNGLQKMGMVSATFDHPIRFIALPFGTAIKAIVESGRERLHQMESEGKDLEVVWNQIPNFSRNIVGEKEDDRFQMLQGQNQIFNKITETYEKTKKEFLVFGSEKDYLRFYHADLLDLVKNSKVDVKLLTSCSENTMYIFDKIGPTKVKRIPEEITENLCFIIKDGEQALFFVKNNGQEARDLLAVWTDSVSIVRSLKLLFDLLLSKTKIDGEVEKFRLASESHMGYDFKLRELEQERLLINEINEINKHFAKMVSKKTIR